MARRRSAGWAAGCWPSSPYPARCEHRARWSAGSRRTRWANTCHATSRRKSSTIRKKLTLSGAKRELYILFSDLEGFTQLSHQLEPEVVARLLNDYLDRLSSVVLEYGGVIDKYVGDAVVAFLGRADRQAGRWPQRRAGRTRDVAGGRSVPPVDRSGAAAGGPDPCRPALRRGGGGQLRR
ncbi:adenylate/guanylate cyclase domain-containing protein [Novosphingobium colocasiae]